MTWKTAVGLALVVVLTIAVALGWHRYKQNMDELSQLRVYKASVVLREQVSEKAQDAFETQQKDAASEKVRHQQQRATMNESTKRVAHEDPSVADFLNQPIPQRLRDADREARQSGGLEPGHSAPATAGTTH